MIIDLLEDIQQGRVRKSEVVLVISDLTRDEAHQLGIGDHTFYRARKRRNHIVETLLKKPQR